jgi:hypothetical protein
MDAVPTVPSAVSQSVTAVMIEQTRSDWSHSEAKRGSSVGRSVDVDCSSILTYRSATGCCMQRTVAGMQRSAGEVLRKSRHLVTKEAISPMGLFKRPPVQVGAPIRVIQSGENQDGSKWTHHGAWRLLSDGRTQFATVAFIEESGPRSIPHAGNFFDQFLSYKFPPGSTRDVLVEAIRSAPEGSPLGSWALVDDS